jgi:membrane-associated phospholipid phosphatase
VDRSAIARGLAARWTTVPVGLVGVLFSTWVASLAASAVVGATPVIPWRFLLALLLFALPLAYAANLVAAGIDRAGARRPALVSIAGVTAGLVFVAVFDIQSRLIIVLALVLLVAFLWRLWRSFGGATLATFSLAAIVLALGFAAVRNLNYVAAVLTTHRLHDATFRDVDLMAYRWLFGPDAQYLALFPLVRSRFLFRLFENAYCALFVELIALVLAFVGARRHVMTILGSVFLCYFAGLAIFLMVPTLGPFVVYPESLAASYYPATLTGTLMANLVAEYHAAAQGGAVNGFGYFIGMPSLHAAIATLCQLIFAERRALFWLFLPVNLLLVLSTVILGYHYLADVPAGMAVATAVYVFWFRRGTRALPVRAAA